MLMFTYILITALHRFYIRAEMLLAVDIFVSMLLALAFLSAIPV